MSEFENNPMDQKKLPGNLNLLTILTFIGSGLLGLGASIYGFLQGEKNVEAMEKMAASADFEKMPDFAKSAYSPEAIELVRQMVANKLPILVVSLLGYALCIWGAIEMRKLKVSGYFSYLAGSVIPYVGLIIFVGIGSITNMNGYIGLGFTALFILLYTLQKKHLK